jgi:aspartate carbamoyltransferase catalytic subunit
MSLRHLAYAKDFSKQDYDEIIRRTLYFLDNGISPDLAPGKVVATLFFQPSTRTMSCFQSAMLRMGGGWIGVMGEEGLSLSKGESLEDTIIEYGTFADCIVMRHPDDDSAERAAKVSTVPFISGGSGSREHGCAVAMMLPLLQYRIKKPLSGLKIGIYGTPEINRVCKALVPILGLYNIDLVIDDLGHFPLPKEVEDAARANGIKNLTYGKLDDFLPEIDILLVTRGLQKGIIPEDKFPKEKQEAILKLYKPVNKAQVERMKKDAIVYMIKPLIFEIERDVDADPRAVYAQGDKYTETAAALMTYLLDIKI